LEIGTLGPSSPALFTASLKILFALVGPLNIVPRWVTTNVELGRINERGELFNVWTYRGVAAQEIRQVNKRRMRNSIGSFYDKREGWSRASPTPLLSILLGAIRLELFVIVRAG
jgi:hypothetical protein